MISYDLAGKTALVTGGASGIGFATARMLAKFGATALGSLLELVLLFYATVFVFIFLVLGITARMAKFSIWSMK